MKKLVIILPLITALLGLAIGYVVFSDTTKNSEEHVQAEIEDEIWTCSMHPQIRQNEPGSCPICGMDLIPLANNSNTNSNPNVFEMTEDAVQLANIQTIIIGEDKNVISGALKLNGKIQVNETAAASLVTHLPGRIEKLYVSSKGEKINIGDKIASIYSPDLVAAQRELIEAKKLDALSPEILKAAKNKLKNWKVDDNFINRLLADEKIVENFTIYSKQSGVVMEKNVTVGDYVKLGDVLFNLQNLEKLWVLFDVYESDLAKISLGSEITFSTPSISNKNFTAKITFIDPLIDATTRVATIRAELNNYNGTLKPEMFVSGTLKNKQLGSSSSTISIPQSAILYTGERSVVYVRIPQTNIPSYEFREITLGEKSGTFYEVIEGLEKGEEIVVNGAFFLDASAQLNNQASMMNRAVKIDGKDSEQLPDYTNETPDEFKSQLVELVSFYLSLKNALVNSDFSLATKQAEQFNDKTTKIDMLLLEGDAHNFWMIQNKALDSHSLELISAINLENQRDQFYYLSQSLIKTLKVFGVNEGEFYIQHCPMANQDQGADWISQDLSIQNPYFGDAMLSCGQTQDTIDKNYKNIFESNKEFKPTQSHNH